MHVLSFVLFVALLSQSKISVADEREPLILGFVPSRSVNEIQVSADKIASYLSLKLKLPVKSITLSNYAAVVVGMKAKRVDIAFVGPLNYLVLHEKTGAYPVTSVVRNGKKGYRALIIANSASGIKTLEQLKGKKFAFGDALSASGNLYPKAMLKKIGIDFKIDMKSITVSSQSAIVLSVMQGTVDAGAIYDDARENPEVISKFPDVFSKTNVVAYSELIPADLQVVRKDLNKDIVKKIREALIDLSTDEEGKIWLKSIYNIDSLVPAYHHDYEGLLKVVTSVTPSLIKELDHAN